MVRVDTLSNTPDWSGALAAYGEGASDVEIAKILNITISKFYQLCEDTPSFRDFADRGRTLSQAWWYEQGRTGLFRKDFNVALWNFNMKNRHGWADRVETNDTTEKEPASLDQAKGQLAAALKSLGKKNPELLSGANLTLVKERDND